ncbi:MAG TPA: tetratricopeptide repeat protein [Blastocatellia bacterium]|nr:tetratricopeptide repeat protein [Blastocatellia bacterium]
MALIDTIRNWLRRRSPRDAARSCPPESDILKYKEKKLSPAARARLEPHFAACHDCRELILLLTRFPEEEIAAQPALSAAEIQQQTARVLQYIEADERRKAAGVAVNPLNPAPRRGWVIRHGTQLAAAAVVVSALVIGVLYFTTRGEPVTESARHSLAVAMKEERRSAARFSGGFAHSPYAAMRGSEDSPDFHLRLAVSQLKAADREDAPAEMRQMLARAHLAFDRPDHARQAQAILESLRARGVETAEVFNDLGVAHYQLQNYDAAVASFDRALTIRPDYAEAMFNRALAKESAARYVDAKRDWEEFIHSTSDASWKAEAERRLAALPSS